MSDTAAWVPISSAVAALLGAGFGAALQGRYGVSGWRRKIRLKAYTEFVNAAHDFNDFMYQNEGTDINESNFDEKLQRINEAESRLSRAASQVTIAGPLSVDRAARSVMSNTRSILHYVEDRDTFLSIPGAKRADWLDEENKTWIDSMNEFEKAARRTLRTQAS